MQRLESVLTVILALTALVVGTFYVRAQLGYSSRGPDNRPKRQADWQELASGNLRWGPIEARDTIIVFSDFQCPFCKSFATTMQSVDSAHPGKIHTIFKHFPISTIHPHAFTAAVGAECSGALAAFGAFHDVVFALQDSIGKVSWASLADRAGVRDTSAFIKCLDSRSPAQAVLSDSAAGAAIGLSSTPTVIVNGWRFSGAPSFEDVTKKLRL